MQHGRHLCSSPLLYTAEQRRVLHDKAAVSLAAVHWRPCSSTAATPAAALSCTQQSSVRYCATKLHCAVTLAALQHGHHLCSSPLLHSAEQRRVMHDNAQNKPQDAQYSLLHVFAQRAKGQLVLCTIMHKTSCKIHDPACLIMPLHREPKASRRIDSGLSHTARLTCFSGMCAKRAVAHPCTAEQQKKRYAKALGF